MVALDFCLVFGTHSDEEENYGIKMGRFSMDIGRLTDQHPVEDVIPVYDNRSGIHFASATIRLTMVYNLENPTSLNAKRPSWDVISSSQQLRENSPVDAGVNLLSDADEMFTHKIPTPNRQKQVSIAQSFRRIEAEDSLPSSARSVQSVAGKPLISEAEISLRNPQKTTTTTTTSAVQETPRKQLVLDVELPRQRRQHPVKQDGYLSSSLVPSPPRIAHFNDEIPSSANLESVLGPPEAIPSEAVPCLSDKSPRAVESEEPGDMEGRPEPSQNLSGPESSPGSSPYRFRGPKRRAPNARGGSSHQSAKSPSGQISDDKGGLGLPQQGQKTKTALKQPKKFKPARKEVSLDSSSEKTSRARQRSPGPSAKMSVNIHHASGPKTPPRSKDRGSRLKRPETKGNPKTSSKRSRPRLKEEEEEEKVPTPSCDLHSSSEAERGIKTTSDKAGLIKSKNLVNSFKQLDDNVGSISRLLTSLLARSDLDLPQYARVAQTEILEDDPVDVVEAALVEELLLAKREKVSSMGASKRETKSAEGKLCEIHTEETTKDQPLVDGLPLRQSEREHRVSKTDLGKSLRESLCIHGVTEKQRDNSPTYNLRLNLNVEKLIISESKLAKFQQQGGKPPTCLLTVSFPGINHCKDVGTSAPEQSITISPTHVAGSELYFGNESQLNWKNVQMQNLEIWKSCSIKTRVLLNWPIGQSLVCEGTILVEEVFSSMPKVFQTKLVLVRAKRSESEASESPRTEPEGSSALVAARLELAIDLLVETSSGKAMTGAWLYVTISSVTGSKLQPDDEDTTGHLVLVVKSDVQSICRIPFYSDWISNPGNEVKAWRPLKGSHPDGVLPGPKQMDSLTLFIEVWRKGTPIAEVSDNLIGLAKVPLKSPSDMSKANYDEVVVAEGEYYIWNPYKDILCGTVEVWIVMGPEAQMLRLLQQNRAARIIQSHASGLRDDSGAAKKSSPSTVECNLQENNKVELVKHVIEATVLYATDLPETSVFTDCEGTFIKYLFPCDEEPFYTQTMEWKKTVHFNGCVHHGIIFPTGQSLDNYFMNQMTATNGDLIFELWVCYSTVSQEETYPTNKLKLSDNGTLSACDMGREPTCNHGDWDSEGRERQIGTAKLPHRSLLSLIVAKKRASSEVRKKFFLPIQLESSLANGAYTRKPTLAVEVSYSILNREELDYHLRNTIFSSVQISENSILEGVVEFDILHAAGLQEAEEFYDLSSTKYLTTGLNSYVRYSLFHQNKALASRYPPCSTSVQPNSSSPQYNWRGCYKVDLNVEVLKELKAGCMSLEVWHQHFPQATRDMRPVVPSKDRTTDVWLGTALIPTRLLVESRQGIEGWYDLKSRKGEKVGTINVEVYFKHWKVRPLEFSTTQPRRGFHE
ncbi:hypothetical protein R1flu_011326 [Riccia fluitans]|uniref:C2 domain-containing protein n=1 Tax=Riccia fluitans TaxID=41844 RepID=A0ABD1Z7H7_9MARC